MDHNDDIRVLVADDSFFIRTYVVELLRAHSGITVVGTASTGTEVVRLARELRPDVITMDYHMPNKNGMEATAEIMLGDQMLPAIIMLSAFDGTDGKKIFQMLSESGAHVIAKPSGEVSLDLEKISGTIIAKIYEVGIQQVKIRKAYAYLEIHGPKPVPSGVHSDSPLSVVVIGASTGGPPLVEHLLTIFPPTPQIAFVVVQHMSKYFTELFAERLDRTVRLSVREAKGNDVFIPGTALVVPGGFSLDYKEPTKKDDAASVHRFDLSFPRPDSENGVIDQTMETIAKSYGSRVFGVLLSGMGSDGTLGLRAIKAYGGATVVQDPETAVVPFMPKSALHEGIVDAALSLDEIPRWILDRVSKL
jgi:two-component system chemotaxis response regulator CheB